MDEHAENVPSRMELNDNKAGMEGLDKERINQIIIEASKGSRFYDNEMKKEAHVNQRIEQLRRLLAATSSAELTQCAAQADAVILSTEQSRDLSRFIVHVDMDAFYAAVEMRDNPKLRTVPMAVGSQSMLSTSNYLARRYGVRAAMPGFIGKKLCPGLVIVPCDFSKYKATSKVVRSVLYQYDADVSMAGLDEAYLDITAHVIERQSYPPDRRTFPAKPDDRGGLTLAADSEDDDDDSAVSDGDAADSEADAGNGGAPPDDHVVLGDDDESMHTSTTVHSTTTVHTAAELVDVGVGEGGATKESAAPDGASSSEQQSSCALPGPSTVCFGLDVREAVREMRHRIWLATRVTASAGIAANCMLAKVCSDKNKPNGQFCLPNDKDAIREFISKLPVRKVSGIGKVTEKILAAFGVVTCGELLTRSAELRRLFSDAAFDYFMSIGLGIGSSWVGQTDEGPKSKSVERTFSEISVPSRLYEMCHKLSSALSRDLKRVCLKGRTVTIKIKTVNFDVKTRARTIGIPTDDEEKIFSVASGLLKAEIKHCAPQPLRLRLMGVRMSHFSEAGKPKQLSMSQLMAGKAQHAHYRQDPDDSTVPPFEVDRLVLDEDGSSCPEPAPASDGLRQAVNADRASRCNSDDDEQEGPGMSEAEWPARGGHTGSTSLDSVHALPAEYQQLQDMTCPVCGVQCQGDLQRLNAHVDVCLRKQELHGLIQTAALRKRCQTSTSITSSASKKKALPPSSSSKRDITSFFKPRDDKTT